MGEASLVEELWHGKSPRARVVAGRSAGFQFSPPLGHCRVGPAECSGDFLQLPGKSKWPGFSAFDPLQRAVAVVEAGQEKLSRADGRRGNPVKKRIKVIRPGLPKDQEVLLHLPAVFLVLARHGRLRNQPAIYRWLSGADSWRRGSSVD